MSGAPRRLRSLRPTPWLVVGGGFLSLQLSTLPWRVPASWDESIYLSQVGDGPALPFVASRARGIVALVAPLAAADIGVPAIRVAIAILASVALVLAFATWTTTIGRGAVWACGVFGASWLALAQGSAVMPNLWAAIAAVGAVGATATAWRNARRGWLVAAGALAALTMMFRPIDGAIVVATLVAWTAIRRAWMAGSAVLVGGVVGIAPWVIEMTVREGGPSAALASAMFAGHVGTRDPFRTGIDHLWLSDGPFTGAVDGPSILPLLWLVAAGVLVAAGLRHARSGDDRSILLVAIAAASAMAFVYVGLVEPPVARFLLPVYALVSVPMGVGLDAAWNARQMRVGTVVFVACWVFPHAVVAHGVVDEAQERRQAAVTAGTAIREVRGQQPCAVVGNSWPQIAYVAGCEGWRDVASASTGATHRIFAVVGADEPPPAASVDVVSTGEGLVVHEIDVADL